MLAVVFRIMPLQLLQLQQMFKSGRGYNAVLTNTCLYVSFSCCCLVLQITPEALVGVIISHVTVLRVVMGDVKKREKKLNFLLLSVPNK